MGAVIGEALRIIGGAVKPESPHGGEELALGGEP